jgi:hypothetical protein
VSNPSIACAINFFNDAAALRGALESAAPFFDNIFTINSGPGGAYSTDGSIELCEQFGATVVFDDIQRGFGAIRSRLIHDCGCSWAFILDADERFHPKLPVMHCEGTERYPEVQEPNLSTFKRSEVLDQALRRLIENPDLMAIRTSRRHWLDFTMRRACQNWLHVPDWQLRIVRNHPEIGYQRDRVMHEVLRDYRTGADPVHWSTDDPYEGLYHDHYHCFYRRTQPGKKEANERNYQRLERDEPMILP